VHVREVEPAVTSKTTTSVKGGKNHYVNSDSVATMLVSDEVGVVAMISVDMKEGKVNGIVEKGRSVKKFTQKNRREKVRLFYEIFRYRYNTSSFLCSICPAH
jgi:hypothetical protein